MRIQNSIEEKVFVALTLLASNLKMMVVKYRTCPKAIAVVGIIHDSA